jgi:carbamoyl-phosphate synthase small subunit
MNKMASFFLDDGTEYMGYCFGAEITSSGEAVFNTAMTGYIDSLTDPSYHGQIIIYTYPIIGNYGVTDKKYNFIDKYYESDNILINGIIISNYSHHPYHWNMTKSLSYWLKTKNIPALYGIDTRNLTYKIIEKGTYFGTIVVNNQELTYYTKSLLLKNKITYGNGIYKILLIDYGVKNNILRCLISRKCTIIRVPWDYDFRLDEYDGLLLSNGPGNPEVYKKITYIQYAIDGNLPIFGICLGNLLLGIATGVKTYKLKYGHRGYNIPVSLVGSKKVYITSQNHGYAIDIKTLSIGWNLFFTNVNDNSCEGLIHKSKPFFSVQFHPESSGGPEDTEFLFDLFLKKIEDYKTTNCK